MKNNITVEEYFDNDQMRVDIFKSKYLKNAEQSIDQCFDNVATEIATVSIEMDSDYWKDYWKDDLLKGIWRPGGSIISGINNKQKKISLFNCTSVVIEDDTLEAIYNVRYECAKMAAYRQGLGIEFSKLRPKGSKVNNSSEVSEGVINWMKSFDSIAEEVGQKGRRPAILSAIKDHHPDVIEFITAKSDLDTLKNMNISVQISDAFMKAVKNKETWELFFDLKGERISKIVDAVEMYELICKQSYDHAEPGIQFIDRMKDGSIQETLGYEIIGTNAPVVGESLVSTNKGLLQIKDIYESNKVIKVLVDSKHTENIDRFNYDKVYYSDATFKKYENQQVYEIKLSNNQVLKCNDQHKWLTNSGYKKTIELTSNDNLLLPSDGIWSENLTDESYISQDYIDGILIGNFVGDGFYTTTYKSKGLKNERKAIGFIWSDENNYFNYIQDKYKELTGKDFSYIRNRDNIYETRILDLSFYNWIKSFGFNGKNKYHIPERCFTDRLFAAGFINGLLSSDGCIEKTIGRIIYTTTSEDLIIKFQKLLSAFGIYCSYKISKQKECEYVTVDGTKKVSNCKEFRYDLSFGNYESKKRLLNRIGISHFSKRNILEDYIINGLKKYPTNLSVNVLEVIKTDKFEDMYCAVVPKIKGVIIDGILSSNCSEKPLPNYGVCALASLNMEEVPFINDSDFHSFMKMKVYSLVRYMDNVIQYEIDNDYKSPLPQQLEIVKDLREIGLGVTNLHMWLYANNIKYDSEESIDAVDTFFKYYQYYAFKASCELAIERGPCNAWTRCNESIDDFKETKFLSNLFNEFEDLKELFYTTGIRNGALLSIAPTGSISMTFPKDCLSSGIEPTIGYAYWRKTRAVSRSDYDFYFVLPSVIKKIVLQKMKEIGKCDVFDYHTINNFSGSELDPDGKIGENIISIITKYIDIDLLKSAHEIDPFKKVDLMNSVQKWVDAAISVTYNLPNNFPLEKIGSIYMDAFDKGLKALSVYRDGTREGILIFDSPVKHRLKYQKSKLVSCDDKQYRPDSIVYHCAPKRPKELQCKLHHCSVAGEKWIVLVGLLNDSPYEVFAGKKNEFFNISRGIEDGLIIKNGQNYTLKIPYRNSYIEYQEITELFMNEEFKALTRMISLSLRHGVYHEFIIKQLKKSSYFVGDFMAVVSRVLNKYIKNTTYNNNNDNCPDCHELLINDSGCIKCLSCGYSRCD